MFFRLSLLLSATAMVTTACSGNGWNIPAGTQCDPQLFTPSTPTTALKGLGPGAQKVTLPNAKTHSAPGPGVTPAGTYSFVSLDMYYNGTILKDQGSEPLLFQVHDDATMEANNPKTLSALSCVRTANTQSDFHPQTFLVVAPTAMEINGDGGVHLSVRTIQMNLLKDRFQPSQVDIPTPDETVSDISQIFNGPSKPINWVMVANPSGGDANDYALIADYACVKPQDPCTYNVVVHMHYTAPDPNASAEAAKPPQGVRNDGTPFHK